MSMLRRVFVFAAPLFLFACQSTTLLPEGEVPPGFLFGYELDRREAPPEGEAPQPDEDGEEAAPPAEGAESPARNDLVGPAYLMFEVNAVGDVHYEALYPGAKIPESKGTLKIDEETLTRVYERVRDARLDRMKDLYVGENLALGKETFHVVGAGQRQLWIDVRGTEVKDLTSLRNDILEMLPDRTILIPPKPEVRAFVLDRRTGLFHRISCPRASEIPASARIELAYPEQGLNQGGFPCDECHPLQR